MRLRRSVPFLSGSPSEPTLLVDRAEARPTRAQQGPLTRRLGASLSLGAAGSTVPHDVAETLVGEQYEACCEYIYSHPAWARVRGEGDSRFLRSYLIENRHYLAAAPVRMSSGIGAGARPTTLLELQARHVVEEAGHDEFFENALAEMGCPRTLVRAARPAPSTVEWIHLMRTVAEGSPLAAALCSGLLEFTAGNRDAVAGWHEHLTASGQLPGPAVAAFFEHVRVDLDLGHGQNWRAAIRAAGALDAELLADVLNDITLVAEIIRRWTDSLAHGLQADLVESLERSTGSALPPSISGESIGLPVWPADVLDAVTHGRSHYRTGTRAAVALGFGLDPDRYDPPLSEASAASPEVAGAALRSGFVDQVDASEDLGLEKIVTGWMRAIDGHALWHAMLDRPEYGLVYGWLVENHHYVAAIWQHCGAAIAACTHPEMRDHLVHHLEEEFEHGAMFRQGLEAARGERYPDLRVADMRPLATTRAFTGYLRELAQRDWKAYVVGVAFLQLTLVVERSGDGPNESSARHLGFYDRVVEQCPEAQPLTAIMRRHDAEDTELDHGDDVRTMLSIVAREGLDRTSLEAAALVPQFTWSFLDGILQHYARGDVAVAARVGWTVER